MEIGIATVAWFAQAEGLARRMEQLGFSSLLFTDSQNLCPEVWSQLSLAARASERIRLGPGVTNSVTRDPALTACAAATLQSTSAGRALLCIGRGDSAVQRIGRREQPVAAFEAYLTAVQAYLRGESVDRDGFASRLEFLPALGDLPKVPLEVMATGPRVIELSARVADRVCLAVGADPAFLADRVAAARRAAASAGRLAGALQVGAIVNCVIHDDVAAAREAVRGGATTFARFSSFRGNDLAALPAPLRDAVDWIRAHYDMQNHTRTGVAHTRGISDAFVDWFVIAGPAALARERFRALAALGLDFVHVVPGSTGADRNVVAASLAALAKEIV
ncbi:MAG TPA: LLM class flavin-dependent oxidoreductase, partial [Myxococcota bacterium]|nr:LLM class flavin-dependent oxidoreductase [Myxococcota bacterium]